MTDKKIRLAVILSGVTPVGQDVTTVKLFDLPQEIADYISLYYPDRSNGYVAMSIGIEAKP